MAKTPRNRDGARCCENKRKNSFFNYKSAALNQLSNAGVPAEK
jgi:hypothetical protein